MTDTEVVTWVSRLAAIAASVAALEVAWVHRAWRDGPFTWRGGGVGAVAFGSRGTTILIALLFGGAVALPWTTTSAPAWIAAGAMLGLSIRFRGAYNGGSDAMLWLVLVGLALARTAPARELGRAGLAYIAAQLVLSYVVAGIAKLGDPRWRDGTALAIVAGFPRYAVPPSIQRWLARPWLGRPLGWLMLGFELCFPLTLVDSRVCVGFLIVGAAFHVANAIAFGLDRFLWTWIAAYPALWFWVERLHASSSS